SSDTVCFKNRSYSRTTQTFKVSIPYSSYKKIEPQEKFQKTLKGLRRVWKLQNGWVDLFLDTFFEQYGIPCSYIEHKGSIHNIGCDPFYVFYWLSTQEFIYKSASRQKKWIIMSVDVTGSLVLPILRIINKIQLAHIFLYQMVVEIEGKTVPICQQLSEKQDMLSIHYWMSCWTNMGNKSPNECISDYSKALIGAITRSFCNRKSLKDYVKVCFDYLIGIENNLPECFVRIDITHMVHILFCRWKCLKVRTVEQLTSKAGIKS
ncbi:Uncharacterized protein FWK35_00033534, partial [Aphis craccivora]